MYYKILPHTYEYEYTFSINSLCHVGTKKSRIEFLYNLCTTCILFNLIAKNDMCINL